ncbi:hypothetical protein BH10ACT3_BH10ACT3_07520 [soil metagenome]
MGMLKGFKDMKNMMAATPGLLEQTNQLQANAQAMQAAQAQSPAVNAHQAFGAAAPLEALPAELAEPIAGVDLRTYAQVAAGLAQYDYDQSKGAQIAAERGINPIDWQTASDGWTARITASPAVARQFNAFYTGRA